MKVEVPCTHCGQVYRISESNLGRTGRCKHCGKDFTLEPSSEQTQVAADADTDRAAVGSTSAVLPEKLGRFEIRARLGAGAFGAVYRAYDPLLKREVALKVPHQA